MRVRVQVAVSRDFTTRIKTEIYEPFITSGVFLASSSRREQLYGPQKDAAIGPLTVEADAADVLEQFLAPGDLHLGADAGVLGTHVTLHVVECVGHGVHGVDDELHLPLLLVL